MKTVVGGCIDGLCDFFGMDCSTLVSKMWEVDAKAQAALKKCDKKAVQAASKEMWDLYAAWQKAGCTGIVDKVKVVALTTAMSGYVDAVEKCKKPSSGSSVSTPSSTQPSAPGGAGLTPTSPVPSGVPFDWKKWAAYAAIGVGVTLVGLAGYAFVKGGK